MLALAGGRCAYCGERGGKGGLTVDHVEPLSLGGPDTPANMLPACWRCNQAKRDMRLEEFRAARGGGAFWFEEAGREPGAGGEA